MTILNATFFLEASDVIAFDLFSDLVQRYFDIHCASNVVFHAQAVSFSVLMPLSSSISYLNTCVIYNYVPVNY